MNEASINLPWWLKKYGWIFHLLITFIGIDIGAKMHENDFGGLQFIWHSAIGGFIIGLLISLPLKLHYSAWTDNKDKSAKIAFFIILSSIFVCVCAGPAINKYTGSSKSECKKFKLKYAYTDFKNSDKYIHLINEAKTERFKPPTSFLKKLRTGDSAIILCIRRGGLGYEYVDEFKVSQETIQIDLGNQK